MLKVKGTGLVDLRKIMANHGKEFEESFLIQLDEELKNMYHYSLFTTMNAVEKQFHIYKLAANQLFPDAASPLRKFGYLLAEKSFNGLYKLFIKIPTTAFIIGKVPNLWNRYFNEGDAMMKNVTPQSAELVITNMPTFPVFMLDYTSGMIDFLVEQAGATQCHITTDASNPNAWYWQISWQ